jgi:hypothetical protein
VLDGAGGVALGGGVGAGCWAAARAGSVSMAAAARNLVFRVIVFLRVIWKNKRWT